MFDITIHDDIHTYIYICTHTYFFSSCQTLSCTIPCFLSNSSPFIYSQIHKYNLLHHAICMYVFQDDHLLYNPLVRLIFHGENFSCFQYALVGSSSLCRDEASWASLCCNPFSVMFSWQFYLNFCEL